MIKLMEALMGAHFISVFSLFDIMRRNQHGDTFLLRDLDQVIPNTVKKKRRPNIFLLFFAYRG